MSYIQMAQLDVLNLVRGMQSEEDYVDFRNMLARYFADKAQKQIDALWENGTINEQTIEQWGNERMRTPYRYAISFLTPTACYRHYRPIVLSIKYGLK